MKKETLNQYLNDELSENESEAVEKDLIKAMFFQEKKEQWRAQMQPEAKVIRLSTYLKAAAAALILFVGSWYLLSQNNENASQRADRYIEDRFREPETKRGSETTEQLWATAKKAYGQKRYADAILDLKKFDTAKTEEQYFYQGLCHLYQKEYTQACEQLLLSQNKGKNYEVEVKWFLSLAYIKQNENAKAKIELQYFIENKNIYSESASELLKILE